MYGSLNAKLYRLATIFNSIPMSCRSNTIRTFCATFVFLVLRFSCFSVFGFLTCIMCAHTLHPVSCLIPEFFRTLSYSQSMNQVVSFMSHPLNPPLPYDGLCQLYDTFCTTGIVKIAILRTGSHRTAEHV